MAANQIKMLSGFVATNDSTGLHKALKTSNPDQFVLQSVLNFAAEMGDDQSIRVLFINGAHATKEAYNFASRPTKTRGLGGHTLAAVYISSVMKDLVDPKKPLSKLKVM